MTELGFLLMKSESSLETDQTRGNHISSDTHVQPAGLVLELLTKRELAQRLKKTTRTIDEWMREGRIPFFKIGRAVLFDWPEVLASLRANFHINGRNGGQPL